MNRSKRNDPRFWARWNASGAVMDGGFLSPDVHDCSSKSSGLCTVVEVTTRLGIVRVVNLTYWDVHLEREGSPLTPQLCLTAPNHGDSLHWNEGRMVNVPPKVERTIYLVETPFVVDLAGRDDIVAPEWINEPVTRAYCATRSRRPSSWLRSRAWSARTPTTCNEYSEKQGPGHTPGAVVFYSSHLDSFLIEVKYLVLTLNFT